jgi:hypothetical protein
LPAVLVSNVLGAPSARRMRLQGSEERAGWLWRLKLAEQRGGCCV